mmetsp:Transcript_2102/g.5921  ORF Transcript_2102/g.5921 Transcript_2102/m.5921 type:complete len:148 (-) Transcript_2102:541-984(-)
MGRAKVSHDRGDRHMRFILFALASREDAERDGLGERVQRNDHVRLIIINTALEGSLAAERGDEGCGCAGTMGHQCHERERMWKGASPSDRLVCCRESGGVPAALAAHSEQAASQRATRPRSHALCMIGAIDVRYQEYFHIHECVAIT